MQVGRSIVVALAGFGLCLAADSGSSKPKSSATRPSKPRAVAAAPASMPPVAAASTAAANTSEEGFKQHVSPVLTKVCSQCHNDRLSSGGLNVLSFNDAKTLKSNREAWETIVRQVRGGEMPPRGLPRPSAEETDAFVKYVNEVFEQDDRARKPDPGRVTARRLNRTEYSNTIRDLLGIDFRADRTFPTDDSGEGFDNIADVLTISPLLMEKYLSAAERIANRAMALEKLPKPIETSYSMRALLSGTPGGGGTGTLRRVDVSTLEITHRFDFDGEYQIRIGMPGERGAEAKPVKMNVWIDGKLVTTQDVETKPSGLVYFDPYSETQVRAPILEGERTIRISFVDDAFIASLPEREYFNKRKNKFLDTVAILGPFAGSGETPSRQKILVCDPKSGKECVDKILRTLARRAYRRPVTAAEVASLNRFVNEAVAKKRGVEYGIRSALVAMLVSPHFLFRIERDADPKRPELVHRVSNLELASRLSYFLWRSMPDEELLSLAEAGKLHDKAVLRAQVKRLIADPRSSSLADDFAGQWLELRNLDTVRPDIDRFLYWGPELKSAMKTETRMFFDHMLRNNRPISEFLDAKYTFLNERLAKFYGIDGVKGSDFRKVDLATDQRGGLLGHASVLTISSYPSRTSVVIRGKYILQNILGTPPPPPPPDVPALEEDSVGTSASLRQQMEKHRSNAVCASCHAKMDALGFGLENYDAIGKWRTKDGKFPIDASGVLPGGKTFNGPNQLKGALLAQLPEFAQNLTEKVMIYALGRGMQRYDRIVAKQITRELAAENYPFQSILYEVVESLPFQSRRGEAISMQNKPKPVETAQTR